MDRDNENIGRATPSRHFINPSRASRMDYEADEEVHEGQISAREPLQNRDTYMSKEVDNREKTQFAKQTMALRKMTQTPVDKVHNYVFISRYSAFLISGN